MTVRFNTGDRVRVKAVNPPGHVRTPYYVRGKVGVIEEVCGLYRNPEELAYGRSGLPAVVNYRVRFQQKDIEPSYRGGEKDGVCLEIYEHWLEVEPQEPL
jgi:nitrile hydratase